jgi:GNAT superfamily N-acetyltransferase
MPSTQPLARRLPDLPRWVEVRDLLLSGECQIFGLEETPALAFALRDPDEDLAFVVGAPPPTAIHAAVQGLSPHGSLIAPPEQAAWLAEILPAWRPRRILLHTLPDHQHLPVPANGQVGFLDPALLAHLPAPADLLAELRRAAEYSPISAAFAGGQPVAFCYAGSESETLWDVSIDTLPDHRRQGYAALCAAHLIRHKHALGRQPVWAAAEDNPASWRLAQKLGFVPVDELAQFEPNTA